MNISWATCSRRTLTALVAVACCYAVLSLLSDAVPDAHAFWSGVVMWAALPGVPVVAGVTTWLLLRRRGRAAPVYGLVPGAITVVAWVAWGLTSVSLWSFRIGFGATFAVLAFAVFAAAARSPRPRPGPDAGHGIPPACPT